MKIGSTFTGCGVFEKAIRRCFPKSKLEFWSEYDKFACQIFEKNFPEYVGMNLGDIERALFDEGKKDTLILNEYRTSLLPEIDFLVGGPECKDLSIAKSNRKGLKGDKSRVFYAYLAILQIKKPDWFLMENVASMSKESRDTITKLLKVEPVEICSDRFTPQKRHRLYWFNWDFDESLLPKTGKRWPKLEAWSSSNDYDSEGNWLRKRQRKIKDGRANTLTTGKGCGSQSSMNYYKGEILTPKQCEKLQGLPGNWTEDEGISDSQRYKMIGNAVTYPVIKAILKQHPKAK